MYPRAARGARPITTPVVFFRRTSVTDTLTIGMLLYPRFTHLDLTGPFEVFGRIPGARVIALAPSREPVVSDTGLRIVPELTLEEAPALDVITVPGGPGVNEQLE